LYGQFGFIKRILGACCRQPVDITLLVLNIQNRQWKNMVYLKVLNWERGGFYVVTPIQEEILTIL